jgi:dTDP-4-amino-4,6-dideoxygalactose transaminase
MQDIQMVDLKAQFLSIEGELRAAIDEVLQTTTFINGPAVKDFAKNMEAYLGAKRVIPCANGTDALQIALMALDLKLGDEVVVPSFTYVATAEVIALLGLKPIMVDVDPGHFCITAEQLESAITPRTRAVVPVHLYGQCAPMQDIMAIAEKHGIKVVEDNAQAIGSDYIFSDGSRRKSGTIAHVGCTSFYPSKNLGAYGDGGAMMSNDEVLGETLWKIANHGQSVRYYHDIVGCNSRLDSIQAAILNVKLRYLDDYCDRRRSAASYYDQQLAAIDSIATPAKVSYSTHVYHQYTLKVLDGRRDQLAEYLKSKSIPTMIYYPLPLQDQKAFRHLYDVRPDLPVTELLCKQVISLPMHPDLTQEQMDYIIDSINEFFQ